MSDLFFNKLAFCALSTGLLISGLDGASHALFPVQPSKMTVPDIAPTPILDQRPNYGALLAEADLEAGKTVAAKCTLCHNLEAGAQVQTGPPLFGVLGRDIASAPGFKYSSGAGSLSAKGGAWDYEKLDHFIGRPKQFAPATGMNFNGLSRPADRINLIAYLRTLTSGEQMPLPPP